MLHIVNGDSVGKKLRQGVVAAADDILVWREIYSFGPVFADRADEANRAFRASYLERSLGIPVETYIAACESQERRLAGCRDHDEVVLWFEYDLFDQAMLCQLLHWFSGEPVGGLKLHLLCIGSYPGVDRFRGLGQLDVEQLKGLYGTWQPISPEQLRLGRQLWEAYAAPDPEALLDLLQKDTSAIPFAQAAFQAQLARLPSTANGLGSVEKTTLEAVRDGISAPFALFDYVGDRLHELGMGDLEFWGYLSELASEPQPLLRIEGNGALPTFGAAPSEAWQQSKITLTDLGRSVLEGATDRIAAQGIDRWFGGIHLLGHSVPWRWDEALRTVSRV